MRGKEKRKTFNIVAVALMVILSVARIGKTVSLPFAFCPPLVFLINKLNHYINKIYFKKQ